MNQELILAQLIAILVNQRNRIIMGGFLEDNNLDGGILEQICTMMVNRNIPKCRNFYEEVIPSFHLDTFKSHFRMCRSTFEVILGQLSQYPDFRKRNENIYGGQSQLCVEKTLLIAIWTLGTPESYRSIGDRFGVAKSTVYNSVHSVVSAIINYLCKLIIKWPTIHERHMLAQHFFRYGLPHAIGALDGCHIPIKKPSDNGIHYFNRKKYYSVVLQAICASNLMFIDLDCRWPGSVHDSRVFRTSEIYPLGEEICAPHYFIVADAAYPCKNWVITPYRNNGFLTQQQQNINTIHSKTRVKIENAFALLKDRFRRLLNYLDMVDMQHIVNTVVACCVLHNICLMHEDDVHFYIEEGMRQIDIIENNEQLNNDIGDDNNGHHIREALTQYLWDHRPR